MERFLGWFTAIRWVAIACSTLCTACGGAAGAINPPEAPAADPVAVPRARTELSEIKGVLGAFGGVINKSALLQDGQELSIAVRASLSGSSRDVTAALQRVERWAAEHDLTPGPASGEFRREGLRLRTRRSKLSGSRERSDRAELTVVVRRTDQRLDLGRLEQQADLTGGGRPPAFLTHELHRRSPLRFSCERRDGVCNQWTFELASPDPAQAISDLVGVAEAHGFLFEDRGEDATRDWVTAHNPCSSSYLNFRITDGRILVALQPSSKDLADVTSIHACSERRAKPQRTLRAGSKRILDIEVVASHVAQIERVAQCYETHRISAGVRTSRIEWDKLGNTLRLSIIDDGQQRAPNHRALSDGARELTIDLFHVPHTGKPALGFDTAIRQRLDQKTVVALSTAQKAPEATFKADAALFVDAHTLTIALKAPLASLLGSRQRFHAGLKESLAARQARRLSEIANLTRCDRSKTPACHRIPASPREKQLARQNAMREHRQLTALARQRGEQFRKAILKLYPVTQAACALPFPQSGHTKPNTP